MKNYRWLFAVGVILLTACRGEELQPQLDIRGHWQVGHGFDRYCEVTATFTEKHFVLSFFDIAEEPACQPELYGITHNALVLQIDSRKDYFDGAGVLNAELRVSVPGRDVSGAIVLTEKGAGLSGTIASAQDPNGLLEPLLGPTYILTRESENWLVLARGTWNFECDLQDCNQIQFIDAVSGRFSGGGGAFTSDPGTGTGPGNGSGHTGTDMTFALRGLNSHRGGNAYSMGVAMFPTDDPTSITSFEMLVIDSIIQLTTTDGNGEPVYFDLYPAD